MSNNLLEIVKKNAGIESYYALAKKLGVSKELVSNWKNNRSKPDGINTLKLVELGKLDTKEAIRLIEGGFSSLSLLIMTSFSSIALLAWLKTTTHCILC